MYKFAIICLLFVSLANGQTKKSSSTAKPKIAKDTAATKDTVTVIKEEAIVLPREFTVYSKRSKVKGERMKLCLNLVSADNILNYCVNDSICKDPEVYKTLFEQKQGDSTYMLVYVQAFSKALDKPECDAGKEVKLFFVRWNTTTNKAIVKQKSIESCMRGITNMTKEPISNWDKTSVLTVNYHHGDKFSEVRFDPQHFLLGVQSANDLEAK
jgi:hypothetical protein